MIIILALIILTGNQISLIQPDVRLIVDNIFMNFQNEIFFETGELQDESGWIMDLPSGNKVTRSFLMDQADTLVSFGTVAVPYLIPWVLDKETYISYIAVYALRQITGLSPYTPYFDREDHEKKRKKAIQIWSEWYEKQLK